MDLGQRVLEANRGGTQCEQGGKANEEDEGSEGVKGCVGEREREKERCEIERGREGRGREERRERGEEWAREGYGELTLCV